MKSAFTKWLGLLLVAGLCAGAAGQSVQLPKTITAGTAFSVPTQGSGKATLYIVGPGGALSRTVTLGENVAFEKSDLPNAGRYTVFLVGNSSPEVADLDVHPASQPATLGFLAKPSRLSVDLHDGISGVAYVFDVFRNLLLSPTDVTFELSGTSAPQSRKVQSRNGVAWVKMNSATRSGPAQFEADAGPVVEKRVIQQVPGDPCNLRMNAKPSGDRVALETDPVRDCSGNPLPDGTIVTFTERYNGTEATVDAPLKRGVAKTDLPAYKGGVITVAAGVVIGNEIRWQEGK